ncbi:MAG: PASTA domain-containing protein [Bacteroidota bacterium]
MATEETSDQPAKESFEGPGDTNGGDGTGSGIDPNKNLGAPGTITFHAKLTAPPDQTLAGFQLIVQYYSTNKQQWENVSGATTLQTDTFTLQVTYKLAGQTNEPYVSMLEATLGSGSFPMVRLVEASTATGTSPLVIGFAGAVYPDSSTPTNYNVDFGAYWLINDYRKQFVYTLVAIPRPTNNPALEAAMVAAIQHPDSLKDFDPATHEVVPKSGNTDTGSESGSDTPTVEKEIRPPVDAPVDERFVYFDNQLKIQKTQIDSLNTQLGIEKQEKIFIQDQLNDKETELEQSKQQVEALKTFVQASGSISSPVNEVYNTLVNEVSLAQEKINQSSQDRPRYTLGGVSLNIKTFVKQDQEGIKVQLIDAANADTVKEGAISDMKIDILDRSNEAQPPVGPTLVPSVDGLTETAARQRLQGYGMKLSPMYQVSETHLPGKAFKQLPKAGDPIGDDTLVTVIFAKASGEFF